jgi:tetratricopeptide (TPR) repeat protein
MFRPYLTYCLLLALLSSAILQSCRQQPTQQKHTYTDSQTDTASVNQLIASAGKVENSDLKSLLSIARQLYQVSTGTGNKRALVYAEIIQATYYWQTASHSQAMQFSLQALQVAEKWGVNEALPHIYRIIANLYKENSNYPMANNAADKGLNAAKLNHDTTGIIEMLGLKAMFTHSYYLKIKQPEHDLTSLGLQFEGLKMAEFSPRYEKLRIRFYNNLAQYYKDKKDYTQTLYYVNKAIVLAKKYNQSRSLTYSYSWLGEAKYFMGQHGEGMAYLDTALLIAQKIHEPYRQMEVYQSMYACYLSTQNYKEALACTNRVSSLRDSLKMAENLRLIGDMQLKYETVKKDQEIILLNQSGKTKNLTIMWVLISSISFLALGVVLFFQYMIIRRKNKAIHHKNQILNEALLKIAHIQSHEVRKPLASILGLMNVFKEQNYEVGKEELLMVEISTQELDEKIRDIISATESGPNYKSPIE